MMSCRPCDGAILALLLDREDGGSKFLWNANKLLPDYTASHPTIFALNYKFGFEFYDVMTFTNNDWTWSDYNQQTRDVSFKLE
jgi:hypothetical protein